MCEKCRLGNREWKVEAEPGVRRRNEIARGRARQEPSNLQYVRGEVVNGEAVAVYMTHADTENVKANNILWI